MKGLANKLSKKTKQNRNLNRDFTGKKAPKKMAVVLFPKHGFKTARVQCCFKGKHRKKHGPKRERVVTLGP